MRPCRTRVGPRRARRFAARLATVAGLLVAGLAGFAPIASAHPTDEIVQQLYLTPERSGLTVELQITPGVLVGSGFLQGLDADGDGTLSVAETAAHAAAVTDALTVEVDGRATALRPLEARYPTPELLAAGAGTIRLAWAADLATSARAVQVHDGYDPGAVPKVQASVLVGADRSRSAPSGAPTRGARSPSASAAPDRR